MQTLYLQMVTDANPGMPMRQKLVQQKICKRLLFFVVILVFICTLPPILPTYAQRGMPRVIDGDSLVIGGRRIRLFGIDAPEREQTCEKNGHAWPCGLVAWSELVKLTTGQIIHCEKKDIDRYNRIVATCSSKDGDLAKLMVGKGWALAYRHYSMDYVAFEKEAKKQGLGIWSGKVTPPWTWRRNQHRQTKD